MHARIVHACRVRPRLPPVGREPSLFPSDGRKARLKRGEKTRSRGTHTVGLLLGHAAHRHPRQHACKHAFTTIIAMHVNAFTVTPSCGHARARARPRHTLSPNSTCASQSTLSHALPTYAHSCTGGRRSACLSRTPTTDQPQPLAVQDGALPSVCRNGGSVQVWRQVPGGYARFAFVFWPM
jgi:hypothetical protein